MVPLAILILSCYIIISQHFYTKFKVEQVEQVEPVPVPKIKLKMDTPLDVEASKSNGHKL